MPYVGHKPILPGQNTNEWEHNVTGKLGEYSNWSWQSSTHLLQDVGDPSLPDHSAYKDGRLLSQKAKGEFSYKPMESIRFSPVGQSAPYVRHINWKWQGVESSEAFPRGEELVAATAAVKKMGEITTTNLDFTSDNLSVTVVVNGGDDQVIELSGNYAEIAGFINALNDQLDDSAFFYVYEGDIYLRSLDLGSENTIEITDVTNPGSSGLQTFTEVQGVDEVMSLGFGYSVDDERWFTFSRHTNWKFYGVDSADATFTGRAMRYWDDEDLPSYARRHAPFEYKGVGDDVIENPGEVLEVKYSRASGDNAYAFQRTQEWFGVASSKAL